MMENKFVWLIAGIVGTYFFMKSKAKKELMAKIDNAVNTVSKENDASFKAAIDAAIARGYSMEQFKQDINTPMPA